MRTASSQSATPLALASRMLSLLVGAVLLASCGGSGSTPAPATRRITFETLDAYWAEGGVRTLVPIELASITVAQAGSSRVYAASPDALREAWSVNDVPAGSYVATITYADGRVLFLDVASGASAVDLGADRGAVYGRARATVATPVTFALSGLQPWDPAADQLRLASWDTYGMESPELVATAGATAGTTDTLDWRYVGRLLAPVDTSWVTQVRASTASLPAGDKYRTVVAAQAVTGVTLVDGVSQTISVPPMEAPTRTGSLRLNWKKSQFAAALEQGGSRPNFSSYIAGQPAPLSVDGMSVQVTGLSSITPTDQDYGMLTYNRFLPESYQEYLETYASTVVTRTLPGTAVGLTYWTSTGRRDPLDAVPDSVVPPVGPPSQVTVGGKDATQPVTGAGLVPTIAWGAPTMGSATRYSVTLAEIRNDPVSGNWALVASWNLTGTSVAVPAGLMAAGKTYTVTINSKFDASSSGDAAPFRNGAGTLGWALFVSQTIQP